MSNVYFPMQYYRAAQSGLLIRISNINGCKNVRLDTDMRTDSDTKSHCNMDLISVLWWRSHSLKTLECMYRRYHLQCMINDAPEIICSENEKYVSGLMKV